MTHKKFLLSLPLLISLVGCGSEKKELIIYNTFMQYVNNYDYSNAYALLDETQSVYMSDKDLEDCLYYIDYDLVPAKKIVKEENLWKFYDNNDNVSYTMSGNVLSSNDKLIIPDFYTSLDLYVPTGSICKYNDIELNSDLITSTNDIETTYTIKAPLSKGKLSIYNELFGNYEREVDPIVGDFNDFEISNEVLNELSNVVINEINKINNLLETDTESFKNEIKKFESNTEADKLISHILDNRRLSDSFTSYHSPVYRIVDLDFEFETSEAIKLSVDFKIDWVIGEGKYTSMNNKGEFILSHDTSWNVSDINDWSFMILSL